jgi:hypothetical protein
MLSGHMSESEGENDETYEEVNAFLRRRGV